MRSGCSVLLLLLGMAAPAGAWSTEGHRQICTLAWGELRPRAAGWMTELLKVESAADFAALCKHPDTAPGDLMSLPVEAHDLNLDRDCAAPGSCPVREIDRALATLDGRATEAEKADALLRLAHFTGEVHQPLSVGYALDRNGLNIEATFLGRATNMYAIWAAELLAAPPPPRKQDTGFDLREITNFLERPRWVTSPPLAWARESYWIMRTPATGYVGNPGGLAFDEVYVAQNKLTASEQLEKAGVRLGYLLNLHLAPSETSLPGLN